MVPIWPESPKNVNKNFQALKTPAIAHWF